MTEADVRRLREAGESERMDHVQPESMVPTLFPWESLGAFLPWTTGCRGSQEAPKHRDLGQWSFVTLGRCTAD